MPVLSLAKHAEDPLVCNMSTSNGLQVNIPDIVTTTRTFSWHIISETLYFVCGDAELHIICILRFNYYFFVRVFGPQTTVQLGTACILGSPHASELGVLCGKYLYDFYDSLVDRFSEIV